MKLIYLDADDTLADFTGHPTIVGSPKNDVSSMYAPGFFFSLKPLAGSKVAVRQLIHMGFNVQILTQPVQNSPESYTEKVKWIAVHFPELLGRINMTQDKGLFVGDYLVDDNEAKWKEKFEANGGKFVKFLYDTNPQYQAIEWQRIVNFFKQVEK